jgi:adenosylmethionine-8-amino-7-oxononanoate aminotransferase
MFSTGGSDAVEGALKVARQYWKLKGQADRFKFISLRQGYHGVHFGGMSVNGNTNFRRAYEPLLPGCFHVDTPWLYHNPYTDNPIRLGEICAEMLEREIVFQGPDTVAAFIAEPVQGAGGVIVPPATYFAKVQAILAKYDVLFIADEVITGFGRTGQPFGCDTFGITPTTISLAKALSSAYLPISAVVVPGWMVDAITEASADVGVFGHGFTYSGHPVCAEVALKVLEIYRRRDLFAHAAALSEGFQARLRSFEGHPIVAEARGIGLIGAIELEADPTRKQSFDPKAGIGAYCAKRAEAHGLIVRPLGDALAFCPPLVITEAELDQVFERFALALDDTLAYVRAEGLVAA